MRTNKNTRQSRGWACCGCQRRPYKSYKSQYIDTGLGIFTRKEIFKIFLGAAALVLGVLAIAVLMGLAH